MSESLPRIESNCSHTPNLTRRTLKRTASDGAKKVVNHESEIIQLNLNSSKSSSIPTLPQCPTPPISPRSPRSQKLSPAMNWMFHPVNPEVLNRPFSPAPKTGHHHSSSDSEDDSDSPRDILTTSGHWIRVLPECSLGDKNYKISTIQLKLGKHLNSPPVSPTPSPLQRRRTLSNEKIGKQYYHPTTQRNRHCSTEASESLGQDSNKKGHSPEVENDTSYQSDSVAQLDELSQHLSHAIELKMQEELVARHASENNTNDKTANVNNKVNNDSTSSVQGQGDIEETFSDGIIDEANDSGWHDASETLSVGEDVPGNLPLTQSITEAYGKGNQRRKLSLISEWLTDCEEKIGPNGGDLPALLPNIK